MSMTKWEGKPQVARVCLWLFYEQAPNINASGTLVGYEVERKKMKWRQGGVIREDKAGWKVQTEEEENKDDRKEKNFTGRKFASLNLYFISSINTSTICVGVA